MKIVGGPDDDTPLAGSSPGGDRRARIDAWCAAHSTTDVCATLHEAGMGNAVAGEMYLPGATVKLSKTPARVGPVPTPGQHTDEVLGGLLGYDRAVIDTLRSGGPIA